MCILKFFSKQKIYVEQSLEFENLEFSNHILKLNQALVLNKL